MSILDSLRLNVNSILGLRDSLGVTKGLVYLVTRTWEGPEMGEGNYIDEEVQMLPTPYIFIFSAEDKIPEGGNVKLHDIVLRQISMQTYPTVDLIDCSSDIENIEKLYRVDGSLYRVIEVTKKHVTWKVILRRLSQQNLVDSL